jgi:hypothetical protein
MSQTSIALATLILKHAIRVIPKGHWSNGMYHDVHECVYCGLQTCCDNGQRTGDGHGNHRADCLTLKAKAVLETVLKQT